MQIRRARPTDLTAIVALYKQVAEQGGGIARTSAEISIAQIEQTYRQAEQGGLMMVAYTSDEQQLLAEIHAVPYGLSIFSHILTNLTIAVRPDVQGQGIGKQLFGQFLTEISQHRPDIGRVELESRASNAASVALYQQLGFVEEGRMRHKTRNPNGTFEDSLLMAWLNPAYTFA